MKKTADQTARTTTQQPAFVTPAYQAPRVQDLGAWQAVTLINSVPFNGMTGLPNFQGSSSDF